jgi:hypothetical protein
MHITPLIALAILSFTGGAVAQSRALPRYTAEQCNERCNTKPREFGTVTNPGSNGKGDCNCWVCEDGKDFYTYPNGVKGCCENPDTAWSFSEEHQAGYCCPKNDHYSLHKSSGHESCCPEGHEFFYDEDANEGDCCPEDAEGFKDGKCVLPGNGGGGGGSSNSTEEVCGTKVCATDNDLGLEYGKCYRIFNGEGQALHRPPSKWDYIFHARAGSPSLTSHMYHFRICRAAGDGDCSASGQRVVRGHKFLLRDEIGVRDQPESSGLATGFVSGGPGAHQRFPDNPSAKPTPFKLVPVCVGKDCGFCLGSGDEEWPGLAEVCPADQKSIGLWKNPRYCVPVTIEKYPCLIDEWANEQGLTGLSKGLAEADDNNQVPV